MKVEEQIEKYIASQLEPKRSELEVLHQLTLQLLPKSKLWFFDGKNTTGKVVTNPSIGYGQYTITYKDGSTKEFYRIGLSGNTTGISVYIMGIADKLFLKQTYGTTIGKAIVTGYCIKFKTIKDINMKILKTAIQYGFEQN